MKCPQCQTENREGRKFCGQCGAKLGWKCPDCGFDNEADEKFCGGCGKALEEPGRPQARTPLISEPVVPPKLEELHSQLQRFIPTALSQRMQAEAPIEGENRLVTAMFADISGFTPTAEALSPEAVADLVNHCFKDIVDIICLRYEGSINRFLGDCVLAFFGAPITHENDPERAILAALDMREALQKLNRNLSIGINTGMMYVGQIGTELYQEYTAEGHAINLARRFQEAAGVGQIIVGETTYKFTRRMFEFEPLGELTLKGISQPTRAYSVLKVAERPQKLRGIEGLQARLVGRDKEFAALLDCAHRLIEEKQGQIVTIIGEAGIGKSRIAAELKAYLEEQEEWKAGKRDTQHATRNTQHEFLWLEGRCVSIGQSISYWPFLDILRTYLELSNDDDEATIAKKIEARMRQLFPQAADEVIPFVGNLLSVKLTETYQQKLRYLTPEQLRRQTLLRLRDIFVALARQKPLILILEDLHWADDLSLDALWLLLDELPMAPLLLLCIYRPEKEQRSWQLGNVALSKTLERYTEITLRPLSQRESRQLIESLLTIENLPASMKNAILEKAEGNPFFVEEVIRSLLEQGLLYQENGRWKARENITAIHVPDTVQSVILSRVDRLAEETKYVLQCASVIGRIFRYRLLGYISRQERELTGHLAQLEDQELVYEERRAPELEYAFKHALTQETTYQGILERRRRAFHHQVAQGIEMLYRERIEEYYEELAYHYNRSGNKEKTLEYLIKAGEKNKELYANEAAIQFYREASELLEGMSAETDPQRVAVYETLGEMYEMLGRLSNAKEAYDRGLEHCHTAKQRAQVYLKLVNPVRHLISHEAAYEYLNCAKAELEREPDVLPLADYYDKLGSHQVQSMGYTPQSIYQAMEFAKQGLQVLEGTTHYKKIAELSSFITWLCITNRHDSVSAMTYAHKGYEAAQRSGNLRTQADAQKMLGAAEACYGDMEKGIQLLEENLQLHKRVGNPWGVINTNVWLGFFYRDMEQWDNLISAYAEGLAAAKKLENQPYQVFICQCGLGLAYAVKGDLSNLMPICQEFLKLGEEGKSATASFFAHAFLAEAYHKTGQPEQSRIHLSQLEQLEWPSREEKLREKVDGPNPWFGFTIRHWLETELFLPEALRLAQKVSKEGDDTPHMVLGVAYAKNGQFAAALEQFQQILIENPINALAWREVRELASQAPHLKEWDTFFAQMGAKAAEDEVVQAEVQQTMEVWHNTQGKG